MAPVPICQPRVQAVDGHHPVTGLDPVEHPVLLPLKARQGAVLLYRRQRFRVEVRAIQLRPITQVRSRHSRDHK